VLQNFQKADFEFEGLSANEVYVASEMCHQILMDFPAKVRSEKS